MMDVDRGLQQVRLNPLVTERGEVMLHDDVYEYEYSYYTNISRHGLFVKLEGLPPILVAYREFHSLVMLTQQYEIIILNESNPDGTILDTPPIKEMICNRDRFFVLDENHNLRELFHDKGRFYLSESHKSDVRLFTFDFTKDLLAIDSSNKTHIFRNGYLRDTPITLEPEHHIRSILHTTSEVVMVDDRNNIWEWNRYRKLNHRGTISHKYRYITYSYYRIYTIDYEGVLRVKQTSLEASEEIIPGTYIKFFQIDQERKAIEDKSGQYYLLFNGEMVPLTLPFRLLSIQEYGERMRSKEPIKSDK